MVAGAMESGVVANESTSGPLTYSASQDVHFYGKAAAEKRRRSDSILLLFRALTFAFSLAAVLVMGTNKHSIRNTQSRVAWHNFDPYRYVLAVNGIICVYSFVETWLAVYTFAKGSLLLPETFQVWFDYGHDQGFAYLLFSANSAGIAMAPSLNWTPSLKEHKFCRNFVFFERWSPTGAWNLKHCILELSQESTNNIQVACHPSRAKQNQMSD